MRKLTKTKTRLFNLFQSLRCNSVLENRNKDMLHIINLEDHKHQKYEIYINPLTAEFKRDIEAKSLFYLHQAENKSDNSSMIANAQSQ